MFTWGKKLRCYRVTQSHDLNSLPWCDLWLLSLIWVSDFCVNWMWLCKLVPCHFSVPQFLRSICYRHIWLSLLFFLRFPASLNKSIPKDLQKVWRTVAQDTLAPQKLIRSQWEVTQDFCTVRWLPYVNNWDETQSTPKSHFVAVSQLTELTARDCPLLVVLCRTIKHWFNR